MLKHVLDMDTGRFTARDGNLTLYVLRLVIRVEDYVRVLLDLMDAPTAHASGSSGRLSTHRQMRTVRGLHPPPDPMAQQVDCVGDINRACDMSEWSEETFTCRNQCPSEVAESRAP